jgi:hypothetical protein
VLAPPIAGQSLRPRIVSSLYTYNVAARRIVPECGPCLLAVETVLDQITEAVTGDPDR